MKSNWIVPLSLALVVALAPAAMAKPKVTKAPKTCDSTVVAAVKAAVEAACPCDGQADAVTGAVVPWASHGEYVSCVAQARNAAKKSAGLSKKCLNDVVPCAANSACGSTGAVACVVTTGVCLDDPTPGDALAEGTCDESGSACDTNADCAQSTCQVADSGTACTDIGGTAVGVDCCE
jgi:hypothetical protein